MGSHSHHGDHEGHRPNWQYTAIGALLTAMTVVELGPLFHWFHLPALVLLAISAVKFFLVVAFFMHLWDDAPIFTKLFAAPMIGAALMVGVLMTLHHTVHPSPGADFNGDGTIAANESRDPTAIAERYGDTYNGACSSWLRSHATNRWYCASPPVDDQRVRTHLFGLPKAETGPTLDLAKMDDAQKKEALMKLGEEKYATCAGCHQKEGQGVPGVFPPLAGAGAFYKDAVTHARMIVFGMSGEIEVLGQKYNGAMPPQHADHGGTLSTLEIAAVATYERNSWGNNDGIVLPEDVDKAIAAGKYTP